MVFEKAKKFIKDHKKELTLVVVGVAGYLIGKKAGTTYNVSVDMYPAKPE